MALAEVPGKVGEYRDTITGEIIHIVEQIRVRVIAPYDQDEAYRRAREVHEKGEWNVLKAHDCPTRLEDGTYEWNFYAKKPLEGTNDKAR